MSKKSFLWCPYRFVDKGFCNTSCYYICFFDITVSSCSSQGLSDSERKKTCLFCVVVSFQCVFVSELERFRRIWRRTPGNRSRISSAPRDEDEDEEWQHRLSIKPRLGQRDRRHTWAIDQKHHTCIVCVLYDLEQHNLCQSRHCRCLLYKNYWYQCVLLCVCACQVWWRSV